MRSFLFFPSALEESKVTPKLRITFLAKTEPVNLSKMDLLDKLTTMNLPNRLGLQASNPRASKGSIIGT